MELDWDEPKRQKTLAERKVDILYAAGIFEGRVLTRQDERDYDGEIRLISTGMVDGDCFVVVHTQRGAVTRLITAWRGGRDERRRYQAGNPG
ncbi:MAG: BrnT family toxin [Beijerinckiaceae bacterium]|nr:BrnT family toxin [Beijerinckiaceae bacterium]